MLRSSKSMSSLDGESSLGGVVVFDPAVEGTLGRSGRLKSPRAKFPPAAPGGSSNLERGAGLGISAFCELKRKQVRAAKYPLPPKGCKSRLPQIKDLASIIGWEQIGSFKNFFAKICHLWAKGFFAAVHRYIYIIHSYTHACTFHIEMFVRRVNLAMVS